MTSEARERQAFGVDASWRYRRPDAAAPGRHAAAVGMGVIVSLALLGLALVTGVLVIHTVGGSLFGRGVTRSGAAAVGQQSLDAQRQLVDGRREAVAAYAAKLAEYKAVTFRAPGAAGINLDVSETRRRHDVLAGLVLDCIDAVDHYNLAAQTRSLTQLRAVGLPEHYVWAVDCAAGQ